MEEIEIWHSAEVLRKQFGEDAAIIAAMRADQLLNEGAVTGYREMLRVVAAINELERQPNASERKN